MNSCRLLLTGLGFALLLTGCQRVLRFDDSSVAPQLSAEVRQVAPQPILDSLAKYGMPVNPGTKPPLVDGVFFCRPNLIINSNYRRDRDSLNRKTYAPTKFRFRDQDQVKLTLKLDYKYFRDEAGTQPSGGQGGGVNGFLSGSGNLFTLFIEVTGSTQEVKNGRTLTATSKTLDTYSGEITPTGIKGLVYAFYMKQKTDPDNLLVPIGTTRVFKDRDGFSEKTTTFRLAAPDGTAPISDRPSPYLNR